MNFILARSHESNFLIATKSMQTLICALCTEAIYLTLWPIAILKELPMALIPHTIECNAVQAIWSQPLIHCAQNHSFPIPMCIYIQNTSAILTVQQLNLSSVVTVSYNGSVMVQSVSESDEVAPLCFLIENAIERRDLVLQLSVNNSQATMMVTSQFATEEGLSCAVLL